MLNAKRIEEIIYNYVVDRYGESEAYRPSWDIPTLSEEIANLYESDWKASVVPDYEWNEESLR